METKTKTDTIVTLSMQFPIGSDMYARLEMPAGYTSRDVDTVIKQLEQLRHGASDAKGGGDDPWQRGPGDARR